MKNKIKNTKLSGWNMWLKFFRKCFNNYFLRSVRFLLIWFFVLFLTVSGHVFAYIEVIEIGDNLAQNTISATQNTLMAQLRIPQTNSSVVSNTSSIVQLLGEIMAPIYQLATPGSNLSYDIYRYLMKHTESELGIDKDFFRRLKRKVDAPTVDIVFAPTNPKVGERVTAFAVPRGFRNSKEKLYFTWYIVHDGEKDVQAGRDEAMGMIARGGYDKDLFGSPKSDDENRDAYNASFGGDDGVGKKSGKATGQDCDGCDCLHNMTMFAGESSRGCFDDKGALLYSKNSEYEEAKDDRGKDSADWGRGVVNSDWITRCYRHNFGRQSGDGDEYSGRDMIIKCNHAFDSSLGGSDNSFGSGDEDKWMTNPENPDTDGDGVVDEADLVGLGQDEFTWIYRKGDRVSVAVEGMSNIMINEGATDRLRYKNKHWSGSEPDLSPTASPEAWYKTARQQCETKKNSCLASTGNSMIYTSVGMRLPADSSCIDTYADCMKDLWEHKRDGKDEDAFGDLTGYYKIMWAAPGICSQENKDEASNDWCDNRDDFGFQYLKLYDPVEKGRQLMDVSVNISPKNPQFQDPSADDCIGLGGTCNRYGDSTDMILASADVVSDGNLNPDYLYYKWSVWRCDPNNFTQCEDVTSSVYPVSQMEGIGVRDIGFYPMSGIFNGEKRLLLKIGVIVKRHKNSTMSSPGINGQYNQQIMTKSNEAKTDDEYVNKYAYAATKLVEVYKNKLRIKLYTATPKDGGWEKGEEICAKEGSLYKKVCPVFPYQVLMAELDGEVDGGVIWKLDGKIIRPSRISGLNSEDNSKTIFFPIIGQEKDLGTISAVVERSDEAGSGLWEDDNLVTERIFSINNPMIKVVDKKGALTSDSIQKAYTGAHKAMSFQNRPLWWILGYSKDRFIGDGNKTDLQTTVNIPVSIIPTYLSKEINGTILKVDALLNDDYVGEIDKQGEQWSFKDIMFTRVREGDTNTLDIQTLLEFNDNYKSALMKSFNIHPLEEIVNKQTIKVKPITPEKYKAVSGAEAEVKTSMKIKTRLLFASVINKLPNYLILFIKMALIFVLVAMISFGTSYGLGINSYQKK